MLTAIPFSELTSNPPFNPDTVYMPAEKVPIIIEIIRMVTNQGCVRLISFTGSPEKLAKKG